MRNWKKVSPSDVWKLKLYPKMRNWKIIKKPFAFRVTRLYPKMRNWKFLWATWTHLIQGILKWGIERQGVVTHPTPLGGYPKMRNWKIVFTTLNTDKPVPYPKMRNWKRNIILLPLSWLKFCILKWGIERAWTEVTKFAVIAFGILKWGIESYTTATTAMEADAEYPKMRNWKVSCCAVMVWSISTKYPKMRNWKLD